jgi:Zn finger protein HypA/HybF involved in hydrogenase expression
MLNISEYTLAQYIRESGISGPSSSESRRQRYERVKYVAEQVAAGRNLQELADDLGLCLSTIYAYLRQSGHVKRSARGKMKKMKCDKCGRREKLERWRGKNLCPSCLNPDTDIDISYAAHWAEYQRRWEMAYY